MFLLKQERIVKNWPTKIVEPTDNGKTIEHEITVDMKMLTTTETSKLLNGDMEMFKKSIKGWAGIGDSNDEEFKFTPENLELLLEEPSFTQAFVKAYMRANSGQAAEKNS